MSALNSKNVDNHVPLINGIEFDTESRNIIYLTALHEDNSIKYAPLIVHSFNLKLTVFENSSISQLSVPERLKWLRNKNNLKQSEVANLIGIDRTNYIDLENNIREVYPIDTFTKLARLYKVDIIQLMDKYNLFIHFGQAQKIKQIRKSLGLKQKELADILGVSRKSVGFWEKEKSKMAKVSWSKLMKIVKND